MLGLLLSSQPVPQPAFLAVAVSLSEEVKIPDEVDGDVIEFRVLSLDNYAKWEMTSLLLLPRNRSHGWFTFARKTQNLMEA